MPETLSGNTPPSAEMPEVTNVAVETPEVRTITLPRGVTEITPWPVPEGGIAYESDW
jgi:hypothetical protein